MIAVIADDITGAAEIAGVGLRYGMTVALTTSVDGASPHVQLWVIALDTRSLSSQGAVAKVSLVVRRLVDVGVKDIFKKTDSVLRGHVIKELAAQREVELKKKVILCPANPEEGRQIVDGVYLINGIPISETSFAMDPEFPATTSIVRKILGVDLIEQSGVSVVNATNRADLLEHASHKDEDTVFAGSAAFFAAYLDYLKFKTTISPNFIPKIENTLYVCGSAFGKSHQAVEAARKAGAAVTYISPLWLEEPELETNLEGCVQKLVEAIRGYGRAILAIDHPVVKEKKAARKLKQYVVKVVEKVLAKVTINELVVEGGSTTFSIVEALKYRQFRPTNELANGVVRMNVEENRSLHLTIKPGSYDFPKIIWDFSNLKNE